MRIKKELFSEFREMIDRDTEDLRKRWYIGEKIKELERSGIDVQKLPYIEFDTGGLGIDIDILPAEVQEVITEKFDTLLKIFGEVLLVALKHDIVKVKEKINVPSAIKMIEEILKEMDKKMEDISHLMRLEWRKKAH